MKHSGKKINNLTRTPFCIILISLILLSKPSSVESFYAIGPTKNLRDYLVEAESVFSGRPIAVVKTKGDDFCPAYYKWTIEIEKVWKGSLENTVDVYTLAGTPLYWPHVQKTYETKLELNCSYLVFTRMMGDMLFTNLEYPSGKMIHLESDLHELFTPFFDRRKPDSVPKPLTTKALLRIIETSKNEKSILRAWVELQSHEVKMQQVLQAAEFALRRDSRTELYITLDSIKKANWNEASPIPVLRRMVNRVEGYLSGDVWRVIEKHGQKNPETMAMLRENIIAHHDHMAVDLWKKFEPEHSEILKVLLTLYSRNSLGAGHFAAGVILDLEFSDPALVKPLIRNLRNVASGHGNFTAWALGYQGVGGLTALIELLGSSNDWSRLTAAVGLGLIGSDAKPAIEPLLQLANEDPNDRVRMKAVVALEKICPGLYWNFYEEWRDDPDTIYRSVEFLRYVRSPKAIQEMIRLLQQPDCPSNVIYGLSDAGKDAAQALPYLYEMRDSGDGDQRAIKQAIKRIEDEIAKDE